MIPFIARSSALSWGVGLILCASARGQTTTVVIKSGDAAPGTPAGVVFGQATGTAFGYPGSSTTGFVAFNAGVMGPGITAGTNDFGIWAGTPGAIQLVARATDPAPGTAAG